MFFELSARIWCEAGVQEGDERKMFAKVNRDIENEKPLNFNSEADVEHLNR